MTVPTDQHPTLHETGRQGHWQRAFQHVLPDQCRATPPNLLLQKFLGSFQNVCPPGASLPLDTPPPLGSDSVGLSGTTQVGRLSSPWSRAI